MEESKLPLVQHFSNLREKPKWGLKLILAIVVMTLSAVIAAFAIDYNELYKDAGMTGAELEQAKMFAQIGGAIGGVFSAIIGIGITFVIFLLISKIMKSDASGKSIFCYFKLYIDYQNHCFNCHHHPVDRRLITNRLCYYKS